MTDENEREAEARWGSTPAYRESQRRWSSYGEQDKAALQQESDEIVDDMAAVMHTGASPDSRAARAVAERHRRHIETWFYPCDHWMHAQVAEMYVYDDRFKDFYERRAEGLAAFFSAAVEANTLVEAGAVQVDSALDQVKAAAGLRAAPAAHPADTAHQERAAPVEAEAAGADKADP